MSEKYATKYRYHRFQTWKIMCRLFSSSFNLTHHHKSMGKVNAISCKCWVLCIKNLYFQIRQSIKNFILECYEDNVIKKPSHFCTSRFSLPPGAVRSYYWWVDLVTWLANQPVSGVRMTKHSLKRACSSNGRLNSIV